MFVRHAIYGPRQMPSVSITRFIAELREVAGVRSADVRFFGHSGLAIEFVADRLHAEVAAAIFSSSKYGHNGQGPELINAIVVTVGEAGRRLRAWEVLTSVKRTAWAMSRTSTSPRSFHFTPARFFFLFRAPYASTTVWRPLATEPESTAESRSAGACVDRSETVQENRFQRPRF